VSTVVLSGLGPEKKSKLKVQADTWGHLKPKKGKSYSGWVLFGCSTYGDVTCLDFELSGLSSSPWFFEDLQEFMAQHANYRGKLYLFVGTYNRSLTGKSFKGRVEEVNTQDILRLHGAIP
jgi:hypothetical protein